MKVSYDAKVRSDRAVTTPPHNKLAQRGDCDVKKSQGELDCLGEVEACDVLGGDTHGRVRGVVGEEHQAVAGVGVALDDLDF